MSTDAPAVYYASPYPPVIQQAARHRAAGGGPRLPVIGGIVLGFAIIALATVGVLLAL
jgi:hypothetical protein